MAPDILYYVAQYLTFNGLAGAGVALAITFAIWEAPRFLKIFDDDVLKGMYPEYGKALDIAFVIIGFISLAFLLYNLRSLPALVRTDGYGMLIAAGIIGIPVIFLLGFFGRTFSRFDAKHEPHVFLVHTGMDFIHTAFYSAFVALALPAATLSLSSFL